MLTGELILLQYVFFFLNVIFVVLVKQSGYLILLLPTSDEVLSTVCQYVCVCTHGHALTRACVHAQILSA